MNTPVELIPLWSKFALALLLWVLHLSSLYLFFLTILYKWGKKRAAIYFLFAAAEAVFICPLTILGEYELPAGRKADSWVGKMIQLPAGVYLLLAACMAILVLFGFHSFLQWRKKHLTALCIQEVFSALPVGLCYAQENGMPLLVNPFMETFSRQTLGSPLTDTKRLWAFLSKLDIRETKEPDSLLIPHQGKVLQLSKGMIEQDVQELILTDVTQQFKLQQELRKENAALLEMEDRLRIYGQSLPGKTRRQEILNAKKHLHDELGRLLQVTQAKLENDSSQSIESISGEWAAVTSLFSHIEEGNDTEYAQSEIEKAAASLGITVITEGELPFAEWQLQVFLVASMECLLNARRHAGADTMRIHLERRKDPKTLTIQYTNNGKAPSEPIALGGGLSLVLDAAKNAGGSMTVDYDPFTLTITLPDK